MAALNKHLEKAEKLLVKGKLDSALEEMLEARQEEPGNDSIVLALADIYQRMGRARDCSQCYGYLFEKYVERNDSAKALEHFRKLQKLGAVDARRWITCAQLLERQKPDEAVEYYNRALELSSHDPETALRSLHALTALQPGNLDLHRRTAELAEKSGNVPLAVSAYNRSAELLTAEKLYDAAVEDLERAYIVSGQSPAAAIALAKGCSKAGQFPRVLEVLAPQADSSDDPQLLTLVAEAYLAEKQLARAESFFWKLAPDSNAIHHLMDIAVDYLKEDDVSAALPLLQKLKQSLSTEKSHKPLMALADKLSELDHTDIRVLEFLLQLADQLHMDTPLERCLHRLFDLYFASGEFPRATEALERLIDVDPYAPECSVKLQQLEGKADPAAWKEMASRLGKTSTVADNPYTTASTQSSEGSLEQPAEETGGNTLGDLILQAEIFLQYKLEEKARERLERIAKLFPGEEANNVELRNLYEKAGFTPRAAAVPARSAAAGAQQVDWSAVSEIIRGLSRAATVKAVGSTAVNAIGRLWQVHRCCIGLATPKRPPTLVLEYVGPGSKPSEATALGKLVMGLQQIVEERGTPLAAEKALETRELLPLKAVLAALQVQSLVAIALRDNDQPAGVLVLQQCDRSRNWGSNDMAALETLAQQILLAVSNARLRSLMKTLAVTDEGSGLLHRDSYLTCLLSEADRMKAQNTPLSVAILEFSGARPADSEQQAQALQEFTQRFGSTFASHLRQTDIAVRYGPHALSVIMPATTGKDAVFMVDKMRKLSASFLASGAESPPSMTAAVAELVRDDEMDAIDIVTEAINRVEFGLEQAQQSGVNSTKIVDVPAMLQ